MIYDIMNLLFLKIALEYYECDHKNWHDGALNTSKQKG